jgi:DNA polymerase
MFIATKGKMLIPYNYAAAHTGRPGGTDGVNVTNFKRGSLLKKAIQAPPGKVLVDVDASQIEARICAWLAGCKPLLDAFADPARDAYCEYGTDIIYGYEIVKGVHTKERQVCKVEVLSLQYGVGAETLQKRLNAEGIVIDRGEAANHVNGYRKRLPEILGNGTEFCNLLKFAVNRDTMIEHKGFELSRRGIKFPTGHWLLYDNLCVNGNELLYYSHRYKSFNKLYAGSMNENLCQTLANIIVGRVHMQFRHDAVFMVYDSIMRLVDAERAEEAREETIAAMSRTPSWAEGLPLAAEGKIKTHL